MKQKACKHCDFWVAGYSQFSSERVNKYHKHLNTTIFTLLTTTFTYILSYVAVVILIVVKKHLYWSNMQKLSTWQWTQVELAVWVESFVCCNKLIMIINCLFVILVKPSSQYQKIFTEYFWTFLYLLFSLDFTHFHM